MRSLFQFGEFLPEYPVRVLNEREARAGAGIFFFLAILAFLHVWLNGNFDMAQFVVITFFVDFFIRVLIKPKYAPGLVLGRIAVRNQTPEYVGAPPAARNTEIHVPIVSQPAAARDAERCKVPEFAKALGHESKWNLHNNCR